ncbi:hypothetical protein PR202_gb11810 [Eleusine coracana subsp. coracana]|uniref:Uncharacterized protein n=1 Tax=Eleusine coracana subsp. coracana TaxID=191504 RepID=A0AAV5EMV0_ELECO|nr:hypothetical protein PR202_gb11810 [Eleusine coracana subsp. coracana]
MAGKRRRSAPSTPRPRSDRSERAIQNRSTLLETINGFYAAALDRLPVDEMPALVPRLLKAGLCVGFSDPVTNIIVNTVATCSRRVPDRNNKVVIEKAAKRRRRKALSRAAADTANVGYLLVAAPALEYLILANADVLTAVRLVEADRHYSFSFRLDSRTTRTAFRCAALASCHPKPRALVNRTYSLASRMEEMTELLATQQGPLSCNTVETISGLLLLTNKRSEKLQGADGVVIIITPPHQFIQEQVKQPPFFPTKSLKSVLPDRIYRLYIDALARLPRDMLQKHYYRSLLKAGHCYGLLEDPVSNIVLNTVWYETVFPPQKRLSVSSVSMISSRSLVRVACRSLHGLVEYLRACFRMVSDHQAMRYLLFSDANIWGALDMARREGHVERTGLAQDGAYKAAAIAAMHPDPNAVAGFLVSTFPSMSLSLRTDDSSSPFSNLQLLSQMLMRCLSTSTRHGSVQTSPAPLSDGGSKVLAWIQNDFKQEERFVCGKVNAALKKYTQQTGGPQYELHIICGFNRNVGNSYGWGFQYGPGHNMRPRKTQYSHINFLASPKGSHSSAPILFFAECSNNEDVIDDLSCCPVMGHPAKFRCFHCENEGAKIVHPDLENYNDRAIYFERMACKDLGGMTVNDSGERLINSSMDICEEDCIYFDTNRDVMCANFLNERARIF